MFTQLAIAGSMIASVLAAPAVGAPARGQLAASVPPPTGAITIELVTANGSGCPVDSAAVALSRDKTAFTVSYNRYTAKVGGGARPEDARKNCALSLVVFVPPGYTWAVVQADYRGYANLAAGATATEIANYYFAGTTPTRSVPHPFSGAYDDNWHTTDITPSNEIVYAPCGLLRNYNINTELRVNAGTSNPRRTSSLITMDSTDTAITTVYHLAWKVCPPPAS